MRRGRHTRSRSALRAGLTATAVLALGVVATSTAGTYASWSDTASITGNRVGAGVWPGPSDPELPGPCTGIVFDSIIIGTHQDDDLTGTAGNDLVFGLNGKDVLHGLGGDDCLVGGNGKDVLFGGPGDDVLLGGNAKDVMYPATGKDDATGGNGKDELHGGAGDDLLVLQDEKPAPKTVSAGTSATPTGATS